MSESHVTKATKLKATGLLNLELREATQGLREATHVLVASWVGESMPKHIESNMTSKQTCFLEAGISMTVQFKSAYEFKAAVNKRTMSARQSHNLTFRKSENLGDTTFSNSCCATVP